MKKHKHEEHQNHERWVISYADMVTLLFALFVVLYALGEVKLQKLKELKKSLAFAFHFEGHGQTWQEGLHDKGDEGGHLLDAAPLLNPQKGAMKEFLLETLPREFEEITGRSIDVELSNDSMKFSAPLSAFFAPKSTTILKEVHPWLTQMVEKAHSIASQIRIRIAAPDQRIGAYRDGSPYFSTDLCMRRLRHLQQLVGLMSNIMKTQVTVQFDVVDAPATQRDDWENVATISVFFTNSDK